jgi:acetyl esterase/lipase
MLKSPAPPLPPNVRAERREWGRVRGEWVEADFACRTLLFLHGGGYVQGSPETRRSVTGFFAQQGFRVFTPEYRLAPEHPFPAAVQDVIAAYLALAGDGSEPIYLAGDSSGGGLALALMMFLRDAECLLPPSAVLFSPWTDLAISGESIRSNQRRCALFHEGDMQYVANLYLGGTSPTHPFASPLYGNLENLPPLLVHVGADETLLDDSTRLVSRAREAGVVVDLKIWPVVPHGWQMITATIPEARQSLLEAADFFNSTAEGPRVS